MQRTFALVVLLATVAGGVCAQTTDQSLPKYGVYGEYTLNRHTADFRQLPGIPNCCPAFTTGDGGSVSAGVSYLLPLGANVALDIRAGWYGYDATLTTGEQTTIIVDSITAAADIEHVIETTLGSIGLEPLVSIRAWHDLSILVGARLGVVVSRRYHQYERLTGPGDGVFADTHTRTRNEREGTLPDALDLHAALIAGLRYPIPLTGDGSLTIAPEALVSYGLTPIVSGLTWSAHSLRLGLAVQWTSQLWVE